MQLHRAHHSVLLNVSWTNTLFLTEHLYYTAALIKKGTTVLSIIKSKQCAEANAKRGIKWKKKKTYWDKNTDRQASAAEHLLPRSNCTTAHNSLPIPACKPTACAHRCHKVVTGLYKICSSSRTEWSVQKQDHFTVSTAALNTWRYTSTPTYTLNGIVLNLRDNILSFLSFYLCVV